MGSVAQPVSSSMVFRPPQNYGRREKDSLKTTAAVRHRDKKGKLSHIYLLHIANFHLHNVMQMIVSRAT